MHEVYKAWKKLGEEFLKVIKKGRAQKLLKGTRLKKIVSLYKQLTKGKISDDLVQWIKFLEVMASLSKTARKHKLISKLARDAIIQTAELAAQLVGETEIQKVIEIFYSSFDRLYRLISESENKDIKKRQEFKDIKMSFLQKPNLIAKIMKKMTEQIEGLLSDSEPEKYLQRLELLAGILNLLKENKQLDMPAKVELQKMLTVAAYQTNEFLKNYPLDQVKNMLIKLDVSTLALVLSSAPLELQKIFDVDGWADGTIENSDDDILELEKNLKTSDENDLKELIAKYEGDSEDIEDIGDYSEVLDLVERFIRRLAGEKGQKLSKDQMKKFWRIIRVITSLTVKAKKNKLKLKLLSTESYVIVDTMAQLIAKYPEPVRKKILSYLPKVARLMVIAKMPKRTDNILILPIK